MGDRELNTSAIIYTLFLSACCYFILKWLWDKKRFLYYAWKVPGPPFFPIISIPYILFGGTQSILENGVRLVAKYKPIFSFWLGGKLFFVVTKPKNVQFILNNALDKIDHYEYLNPVFGEGLMTLPVKEWKIHRRTIAHTFNQNILNNFVDIFGHYSNGLVKKLESTLGKGCIDLFPILTQCTLDIVCGIDTTMGIKVNAMKEGSEYILWTSRASELAILRIFNFLLHPDFIWKRTSMFKESENISEKLRNYVRKIIEARREKNNSLFVSEENRKKIFLDYLLELTDNEGKWSDIESIEESRTVVVAGSDATALTVGNVLMMLGMHQKIQDKVFSEISLIFEDSARDVTVEDLSKLTYLECAIKETMRLFPVASFIARVLTKDAVFDGHVLPKGSSVFIPILYLHRSEEFWDDALKFNPDRFLPEKSTKIDPYTYLPFSAGPRNCIGFRYAMMAVKTMVTTVLRYYKVKRTGYDSVADIKLKFDVATKSANGQKVELERRQLVQK